MRIACGSEGQSPVIDALGTLRGDEFVATYKFKWNATSWPGVVVRWLNPREFLTVWLSPDDGKAYLYRQTADRAEEEFVAVSPSGVSLTSGQWYDAKVVVHDDTLDLASLRQGQVGSQVLDFYVDANQDSDFLDAGEQLFDDEGAIDDNWSAGDPGSLRLTGPVRMTRRPKPRTSRPAVSCSQTRPAANA